MWRISILGRRQYSTSHHGPIPQPISVPNSLAKYKDPHQLIEKLRERVPKHGYLAPTLLHAEPPSSIADMVRNFKSSFLSFIPALLSH